MYIIKVKNYYPSSGREVWEIVQDAQGNPYTYEEWEDAHDMAVELYPEYEWEWYLQVVSQEDEQC